MSGADESGLPMACTLGQADLASRLAAIRDLSARWLVNEEAGERSLTLKYRSEAFEELSRLVVLERDCCAFLKFDLSHDPQGVELRIEAPTDAGPFAPVLFEHFRIGPVPCVGASRACTCGEA